VLVADQAKARIFAKEGPRETFRNIEDEALESLNRAARDIMSDRPGRTFDSASPGRHAKEPTTNPRKLEKQKFITEVAARLNTNFHKNNFERLVVVAPPVALGLFRTKLSPQVRAALTAEIGSDLVHLKDHELTARLNVLVSEHLG
jgi:protein required for attachment to host cells